jgi:hypothetical protein
MVVTSASSSTHSDTLKSINVRPGFSSDGWTTSESTSKGRTLMATKKQKREAALAKREKFLQETKESGLKAQQAERQHREMQKQAIQATANEINARYAAILAKHGIHH